MRDNLCASFANVFTAEELASIRLMGESAMNVTGTVENAPDSHRSCSVAWLDPNGWLGEKLDEAIVRLNDELFGFDLEGFAEPLQYTCYREGGYYGWHMDKGENTPAPRKLSLTLQLSGPGEYDGGDFQINTGSQVMEMEREAGRMFVFPSWVLHQVTPVSRGTRRSLVVWIAGPDFR